MTGTLGRAAAWMQDTAWARAVYDVVAAIVADATPEPARLAVAAGAPVEVWAWVLALEGCGAWLDGARRHSPAFEAALMPADALVRAAGELAFQNAVVAAQQVAEIATIAAAVGVRVLALKGVARLLAGEVPGSRLMSDIDLLVVGSGAATLHTALQTQLGYVPDEPGTPARHLPPLVRIHRLPVEIHQQLSDRASSIDRRIWDGARCLPIGNATIEIPDATALLIHALDHGIVVHRAARYRLRDVLDIATLATATVDSVELEHYVAHHRDQRAVRTLLAAAMTLASRSSAGLRNWPLTQARRVRAWRQIHRVGRARLLAPVRLDIPAISDPRVLILSQLAQGSPRVILRLALHALAMPGRAVAVVSGQWLPVEARQTQAVGISPPSRAGHR